MIKKIRVKTSASDAGQLVEVGQIEATVASKLAINESGNFEVKSSGTNTKGDPQKVNINSAGDIQVKVGAGSVLQLDAENETTVADKSEYSIKFCNGAFEKANRVIRAKINVAELVLDTQNSHSTAVDSEDAYDKEELQVKFRCDKANHPIYAKMKARAFDFRCLNHGGIALQIAGQDSDNHENKIKFESDRISALNETPLYGGEGGKGLEFGTFNNEKASLFCGEYRFKGDAKVYGATRGTIEMLNKAGEVTTAAADAVKFDYPTQADDFKDVVSEGNQATWNEIITVARAYADGTISAGSGSGSSTEEGESGVDHSIYATKTFVNSVETVANEAKTAALAAKSSIDVISPVVGLSTSKNFQIDASSVITNSEEYTAYQNYLTAKAAYDEYVTAYNQWTADKEAYDALTEEEKAEATDPGEAPAVVISPEVVDAVSPKYANVNIKGLGKSKIETTEAITLKTTGTEEDIILDPTNNVVINAAKVKLWGVAGESSTEAAMVESVNGISMGETPEVTFLTKKISAKCQISGITPILSIGLLNNFSKDVYYDAETGKVHIPYEFVTFYKSAGVVYDPKVDTAKVKAYVLDGENLVAAADESYFVKSAEDDSVWIVKYESGEFKKVDASKPANHGLVSTLEGYADVVLEDAEYTNEAFQLIHAGETLVTKTINVADVVAMSDRLDAIEARLAALENPTQGE